MRREDIVNIILIAVILALLLVVIAITPPQALFFAAVAAFLIVATLVFAILFLPWRSVARSPLPPQSLLKHLVYQLRRQDLRVEESPEGTTVRLGPIAAVRFRILESPGGSEVRYQPYATASGWGTLITLIVLVWTSLIGICAVAYVAIRAHRFAERRLGPLVVSVDSLPPPPSDDIGVLLVNGLSEGHRLASEAYEAQRSAYVDTLAVIAVASLLVWAVSAIGLFLALPLESPWRGWVPLLGSSAIIAAAAAMGLVWVVRRRVRPRLLTCQSWVERFHVALARETAREAPGPQEPSSVELLLEANGQLPAWLQMRRWAGLSGDQAAGWIVFLLGFGAFWVLWLAVDLAFVGDFLYALLAGLGGTGLAVATYAYWVRWRRKQEEAIARTLEEWRQRAQTLRSRLDRFLQDL